MGQAISKTVAIAEIIKQKRIPGLHQDTSISSTSITDVWEPIEEGLVPLTYVSCSLELTRHVSMISISLSTRELNKNSPGNSNINSSKCRLLMLMKIHMAEGVVVEGEGEEVGAGEAMGTLRHWVTIKVMATIKAMEGIKDMPTIRAMEGIRGMTTIRDMAIIRDMASIKKMVGGIGTEEVDEVEAGLLVVLDMRGAEEVVLEEVMVGAEGGWVVAVEGASRPKNREQGGQLADACLELKQWLLSLLYVGYEQVLLVCVMLVAGEQCRTEDGLCSEPPNSSAFVARANAQNFEFEDSR
ncbi:hypothetical protein ACLOJK_011333 [Asimina triloba]